MARCLLAILAMAFLGCHNSTVPQQPIDASRKTTSEVEEQLDLVRKSTEEAQKTFEEATKAPKLGRESRLHPAEVVADELVSVFSREALPEQRPVITRLNKLKGEEREQELLSLQRYVRSQQLSLWFTEIVVLDGKEDVATCFFRSGDKNFLVVMLAVHEDSWIVTAYETPEARFARREDETVDIYATKMVIAAKVQGTVFREGPLVDGLYFIEH